MILIDCFFGLDIFKSLFHLTYVVFISEFGMISEFSYYKENLRSLFCIKTMV